MEEDSGSLIAAVKSPAGGLFDEEPANTGETQVAGKKPIVGTPFSSRQMPDLQSSLFGDPVEDKGKGSNPFSSSLFGDSGSDLFSKSGLFDDPAEGTKGLFD